MKAINKGRVFDEFVGVISDPAPPHVSELGTRLRSARNVSAERLASMHGISLRTLSRRQGDQYCLDDPNKQSIFRT